MTDELLFLPLGGTGEIGMNLNLYAYGDAWIMADLGISFADPYLPGVDVIMPEPQFIVERRKKLLALFVTHAHEDHAGAVAHLWPRLRCPVYATPFTAAILRGKLGEAGLLDEVPLHEVPLGARVDVGPFRVDYVSLTHSIPEPNALLIETPAGRVFHTGDWKLDPDPLVGLATDEARMKAIGDQGVLAMVCDSTNVFNAKASGSELTVRESLKEVVKGRDGRIVVTTFASNIARLGSIGQAAASVDRHLCLVGRALVRNFEAARALGYLADMPPIISEEDAGYLPPDKVLYIVTGCQGEPRAALWRIISGQHRNVALEEGDLVIFSSKIIPGNEIAIGRMINEMAMNGIEVITEKDAFVHVSGHPGQEELRQMYQWIRPQIAIPVHGEPRHLLKHAELAREFGVPEVITAGNGAMVRLGPGAATIVDWVETGRLALDGSHLVPADDEGIAERRRLMFNGYLGIAVAVDGQGSLVAEPSLEMQGLPVGDANAFAAEVRQAVTAACERFGPTSGRDTNRLAEAVRVAARRVARAVTGKTPGPVTRVHVLRV